MTYQSRSKKALVFSVGTTADPIIHSIKDIMDSCDDLIDLYLVYGQSLPDQKGRQPVDVACHARDAAPKERTKAILKEIENPQDLNCCIYVFERVFSEITKSDATETIVNITGGTKTMAGALTLVAVQKAPVNLIFEYVGGERTDASGRVNGQMIKKTFNNTALREYLKAIRPLVAEHSYARAATLADMLPPSGRAGFLKNSIHALLLWDNFQYREAFNRMPGTRECDILAEDPDYCFITPTISRLRHNTKILDVINAMHKLNNKQGNPTDFRDRFGIELLLLVSDALENARRRITEKKYSDAVMRSYRSIEVATQVTSLKKYGISPWNPPSKVNAIDISDLIGPSRNLALYSSCLLLQRLGGQFDVSITREISHVQENRNFCFLEHGYKNIDQAIAEKSVSSADTICKAILSLSGYSEIQLQEACTSLRHSFE